jgi:short subunit dehydrogenase-like uncharacterized protein
MITHNPPLVAIVGATGATGRPLAERAVARGWRVRLVGRNRRALDEFSRALGDAEWWTLRDLTERELATALEGASVVVNLVGPFSSSTRVVLAAALASGAHYLDIANEYAPAAHVLGRDRAARERGVTLMPAVGFGTVATEGLAAHLADGARLDRANVAMFPQSAVRSKGALTSVLGVLADGGAAIERGRYRRFALGRRAKGMLGPAGPTTLIPAATGDLATVPATLGARFVTSSVGVALPPVLAGAALPVVSAAARSAVLQRALHETVQRMGSLRRHDTEPQHGPFVSYSWARVTDEFGASREGWMRAGEGYSFTVNALAATIERVLAGEVRPGAMTAVAAFGGGFLRELPGVSIHSSLAEAMAAEALPGAPTGTVADASAAAGAASASDATDATEATEATDATP